MTRLAVLADVHCDDYGSKVDAATGLNARWVDTVEMVRWVANDAKERGCDALVVAGDLTESRHPAPWRVAQIGEALDAFDGVTVLARGNHDGIRAGRSIVDVLAQGRKWWSGFSSPGVTLVGETAIAVLPFLDRHHLRALPGYETIAEADVSGILAEAYLTLARGLYVQAYALAPQQVLVVHQALAGGLMSDSQAAFLGDQGLVVDTRALGDIGFSAVLAGHFHKHQVISEQPLVVYAGSPYRTDYGEEHQAKGYLVVDVDAKGARFEFVETPARRFVTLTAPRPEDAFNVSAAVVRAIDVPPDVDVAALRRVLEADGAFEIQEIRIARPETVAVAGGMDEGLAPGDALLEYFTDDPDREALVARGRELLAEAIA